MRKYTVVILNQLNIKNNKINKIILKKFIMKKKKHSLDKYLVKKKIYRKNYSKISSHFKLLLTRAMITAHPKAKLIYIKKKHSLDKYFASLCPIIFFILFYYVRT
jgi:hypothetical protein